MRPTRDGRRARCRRLGLILGAVAVCIGGTILVILLAEGTSGLARLFTVPWLEARSGRKYTPAGAFKRYFEKRREEEGQE